MRRARNQGAARIRLLRVIGDYAGGVRATVGAVDGHLAQAAAVGSLAVVYYASKETEAPVQEESVAHEAVLGEAKGLDLVGLLRMACRIRRICRRDQVNVICLHSPHRPIGLAAVWVSLICRIPLCLYYHGGRRRPWTSQAWAHLYALLPRLRSRLSFVVAEEGKQLLGRRARVMPPPISDRQLVAYANGRRHAGGMDVGQLGSPCPTVLYPARFVRNKGQTDLVEVARRLRERSRAPFRVLLVGHHQDQDYTECVRERVREYGLSGQVEIRAHIRQEVLYLLYRQCAVVVFPTYEEGFGRIIVEAGVAGVPTVAYRTGGVQEVIEHAVTGLLVARGDVVALADSTSTILAAPTEGRRLGSNARRLYRQRYRSDHIAQEFLWALRRMVA